MHNFLLTSVAKAHFGRPGELRIKIIYTTYLQ